eukprot:2920593-Amphidinium_carterae.1
MLSFSDSNICIKTAKQEAAKKSERKKKKRFRQNEKKKAAAAAAFLFKMACIGSSDFDGFVCVDMEDVKFLADKASKDKIQKIEKNLERLKTARKNALSTDFDQSVVSKVRRSDLTEKLSFFAAQLPFSQGVVDMAVSGEMSVCPGHL